MEIEHLQMVNFRNYRQATAEFCPGLNLIVGRNGQGKTNLLEAVHALGALSSHRSSAGAPMIHVQEHSAVLHGLGKVKGRQIKWDAEFRRGAPGRLMVNGAPLRRSSSADVLASVHFSPEDLALVKGGPERRRSFLDGAAARCRPAAAVSQQEFDRTLRQRNQLLKAVKANPRAAGQLDVWTRQLAAAGARVAADRYVVAEAAAPLVDRHYRRLSGSREPVRLRYSPAWALGARLADDLVPALLDALEAARAADLERAVTTVGPHRDDLVIAVGDLESRQFASQGEQRTAAIALRLAELDMVTEARSEKPVLLLDDVFSELDELRRGHVADLVASGGQTIATTTSAQGLEAPGSRVIFVEEGRLSQVG